MNDHASPHHAANTETPTTAELLAPMNDATTPATEPGGRDALASSDRRTTSRRRTRTDRRARPDAAPVATGTRYGLLSRLLKGLTPEELTGVLRTYPDALERGVIQAVELSDKPTFEVKVLDAEGRPTTVELPEELVLETQAWTTWLAEERRNARYAVRARRGDSRATEAAIRRGEEDFERLFEIRRQVLRAAKDGAQ